MKIGTKVALIGGGVATAAVVTALIIRARRKPASISVAVPRIPVYAGVPSRVQPAAQQMVAAAAARTQSRDPSVYDQVSSFISDAGSTVSSAANSVDSFLQDNLGTWGRNALYTAAATAAAESVVGTVLAPFVFF